MELQKAKEIGLFRFTVNITEFFEGSDEELSITLGEPSMKDFDVIRRKESPSVDDYAKLFKTYMVEHPFTNNGAPAKSEEVVKLFNDMPVLFIDVTQKWLQACPLAQRNRAASESSAP